MPLRCGPRGARRGPGRAGAILGRSAASQPPRGARSAGAGPRGLLPAGCRGSARGGVAGRARSARTGPPGWAAGAGPPPPPLRLRPAGLGPALRRLPGGAERPPLGCPRASAPSLAPSRRLAAGPARGWELGAWLPRQRCPSLGGAYGSSRHAGQRWLLGFCSALNPPPPLFFLYFLRGVGSCFGFLKLSRFSFHFVIVSSLLKQTQRPFEMPLLTGLAKLHAARASAAHTGHSDGPGGAG